MSNINRVNLYRYKIISVYTGNVISEVIGTKSDQISSGKTFIYENNSTVAIVPQNALILIEQYIPKSDAEIASEKLKEYSKSTGR